MFLLSSTCIATLNCFFIYIIVQEQEVNDRIAEALVHLDDPDIIIDLRRLNGKVKTNTFDAFWDELQKYVDELNPAVDERRQSSELHMPIAISISNLREVVSNRLKPVSRCSHIHSPYCLILQPNLPQCLSCCLTCFEWS